ncbi:hypothetical protein VMCG_01658 [Cytospora schulzeri]|uniref:Uncharacterized protein n=1 Tax=Cytospora schulzeri TaxID=448051 RepID=A0A423X3I8_9PEZI|nr:hypothetical protein VMCG_01658 [Valsa malicola]
MTALPKYLVWNETLKAYAAFDEGLLERAKALKKRCHPDGRGKKAVWINKTTTRPTLVFFSSKARVEAARPLHNVDGSINRPRSVCPALDAKTTFDAAQLTDSVEDLKTGYVEDMGRRVSETAGMWELDIVGIAEQRCGKDTATSNWKGGEGADGTRTARVRSFLLLRPCACERENCCHTSGGTVGQRTRHNRDLMLACREARDEIERNAAIPRDQDGLVHGVYYRHQWEQAPTISTMVDEKVNISGQNWVAERLRDS